MNFDNTLIMNCFDFWPQHTETGPSGIPEGPVKFFTICYLLIALLQRCAASGSGRQSREKHLTVMAIFSAVGVTKSMNPDFQRSIEAEEMTEAYASSPEILEMELRGACWSLTMAPTGAATLR